nr:MFS transporter [Maliibacterium massiliense]
MPKIFYVYFFVTFMGMAINNNFFSLYFTQKGMTSSELGLLFGLAPLAGLIAQPIWGAVGDRAKSKNAVLAMIIFGGALMVLLFSLGSAMWYYSLIMVLFLSFNNSIVPMEDTIVLEYIDQNHVGSYAPIRMVGTLGFATMSICIGAILNKSMDSVFIIYCTLLLVSMVLALCLPKVQGHRRKGQKVKILPILKQKDVLLILIISLFINGSINFSNTFFGPYLVGAGGNRFMVGVGTCLLALSEIPFHLGSRRLMERWGIGKMLLCSSLVASLRWLIVGLTNNPVVIMISPFLQGISWVPMIVAVVEYINNHVPDALKASGQMAYTIVGTCVARALFNVAGGQLANWLTSMGLNGVKMTFLIMSPVMLIAGLACCIPLMGIVKRQRAAEEAQIAAAQIEAAQQKRA